MMDGKHVENFNFHNTQEQLQFVHFRFKVQRKMPFNFVGQIWLQGCYITVKSELLSVKVIIHFVTYLLSRPLLSLFAC